ncbi:MAG: FAD-dependent oxidoreductase [Saprospiraceae bacterium]|nr:FAD-dependent oxidoreductase [Saprospiraceae bacterium]
MKKYDVIVIGAGSAGLGNAGVAHTIGLKTLLIEKDAKHFGGDCTNFGCVPSKALIHIAQQFHAAKNTAKFGLKVEGKANMQTVLKYIHEKQAIIRNEEDAVALKNQGQDVVIGHARFVDKNTVSVDDEFFSARIIILCTGSAPRMIDIRGMDKVRLYNNENLFYECDDLPDHFLVIGGGPIGVEMAQAFSRLGSQVTIVNRGERLLKKEPVRISAILQEQLESESIRVINAAEVKKFDRGLVYINTGDELLALPCDATLMAIGRVVNIKDMDLDKAGIELDADEKIKVNSYLQSSNKQVYVAGDAVGAYMFSHGAEKMVRQLWRNLLIPFLKKTNTTEDLSWVTFTDPQVAHFGDIEKDLDVRNVKYHRQDQDLAHDDRAIIQEYRYGFSSFWMTPGKNVRNRKILSGSMIAPQAGELIQEMQLAKHAGIPIKKITSRVYPYPVASRINQKTMRGVMAHSYTNWKKKLARTAFRFFHY